MSCLQGVAPGPGHSQGSAPHMAEIGGGEAYGGPSYTAISDLPVLPSGHGVWDPRHTRRGGITRELSWLGLLSG